MLLRPTVLAIAAALALCAPAALADSSSTPVAAEVQPASTAPTPASHHDTTSYAQREHHDKNVANYRGGSILVIGISGGALVVIIILLLLLA
jgi:hypothetical protein